jgi:SAM-dependent methyltransferase
MNETTIEKPKGLAEKTYLRIVRHYEECLARHGDTHLGVDWPDAADARLRYQVMLDLVRWHGGQPGVPVELLDFGCGAGHFLEFLREQKITSINYQGLDLSEQFITLCRSKFPAVPFSCLDVLSTDAKLPPVDYVIANGVFTVKKDLAFEEMMATLGAIVRKLWAATRRGLAFNVMSTYVDWQRDDLFHVPLDRLTSFLTSEISRHLVVRTDYGLYEYTVYVYRQPLGCHT